jgi:hypothetical protein
MAHDVEMRTSIERGPSGPTASGSALRTLLALLVVSISATAAAHGPPVDEQPPGEAARLLGMCRGEELVGMMNVPPPSCVPDESGAHGTCGMVWGDGQYLVDADFCDASGALAGPNGAAYICAVRWRGIWMVDTHEVVLPWRAGHWPPDAQRRLVHARTCFTRPAAGASR